MRIAFIADGRSTHAISWIKYFTNIENKVLLISTYPTNFKIDNISIIVLPGIFRTGDSMVNLPTDDKANQKQRITNLFSHPIIYKLIDFIWQQVKILDVFYQAKKASEILKEYKPDLVHCLRIQNESYVGTLTRFHPLIISSWGSDFIFTAHSMPIHKIFTRYTMGKTDAFIADCNRDIRLAHKNGLPGYVSTFCCPGNGGLDSKFLTFNNTNTRVPTILYNRGYSLVTRVDTLLKAFNIITHMEGNKDIQLKILVPPTLIRSIKMMCRKLKVSESRISIIASVSQQEMIKLLENSQIFVSPLLSDGTPNSMLEAMACGTFPVMSKIESIQEWIVHKKNGLLFNPNSSEELADCLLEALNNEELRKSAIEINGAIVNERANYINVMQSVNEFYDKILSEHKLQ